MINIPKNDYVENTSINEETVQGICNAFLNGKVWHPLSAGAFRKCNNMLMAYGGKDQPFKTFADWEDEMMLKSYRFRCFNEAEMRMAWKELIVAGYHMFEMREYGSWYGYKCCKQPYYNGGREVADFDERWT